MLRAWLSSHVYIYYTTKSYISVSCCIKTNINMTHWQTRLEQTQDYDPWNTNQQIPVNTSWDTFQHMCLCECVCECKVLQVTLRTTHSFIESFILIVLKKTKQRKGNHIRAGKQKHWHCLTFCRTFCSGPEKLQTTFAHRRTRLTAQYTNAGAAALSMPTVYSLTACERNDDLPSSFLCSYTDITFNLLPQRGETTGFFWWAPKYHLKCHFPKALPVEIGHRRPSKGLRLNRCSASSPH